MTLEDFVGHLRQFLRLALDLSFGLVLYDSTKGGDAPSFTMLKLLPENRDIYAEATVQDLNGNPIITLRQLAGHTGPRLELLDPNKLGGASLQTRRPTPVFLLAGCF